MMATGSASPCTQTGVDKYQSIYSSCKKQKQKNMVVSKSKSQFNTELINTLQKSWVFFLQLPLIERVWKKERQLKDGLMRL